MFYFVYCRNDTMDAYTIRKKTIMAVFNWLLFTILFCVCLVYVTPNPPAERCFKIGGETKCFSNSTPFHDINMLPEDPKKIPVRHAQPQFYVLVEHRTFIDLTSSLHSNCYINSCLIFSRYP